ncbi:MAG: type IX secretion system protein PorQ [Ignavibacteria bacterium]|nr:type IX secretion system protein PorQ [Ignavibacteria bacterium]
MKRIRVMRNVLLSVIGILVAESLHAGTNTVYNFLRLDVGARAAGMAGSFVSVMEDPNAIFYNPAGLSTLQSSMASVGFFKHLLDINSGYLSYSQALDNIGYFGAGIVYTNYGSFDRRDELGNADGTFSAGDVALVLGYANLLEENLYYGANVKFIYSSIADYASSGLAADVGILYNIPESRVSIGASIRNLGAQLTSYADTKEDLPVDVVVGGSIVPRGLPLLLNVNFHKLNEDADDIGDRFRAFTVGGEFTLSKVLQIRVGYDNEKRKDLKIGTSAELTGFSGGVGINVNGYKVDYALSSFGEIGSLHRISIGTSF